MNQKGVSYWAIIIVMAFVVIAMIVAFWPQDISTGDTSAPTYIRVLNSAKNKAAGLNEKAKIEKWLVDNKLNEFGEPADTLYAGGTPLFDEATGKTMDRYDYILKNHPDKPWNR
ncbi:MAG TPA: hypothetical protein P5267_01550 [Patescibacteria group bacterium]|nr:hypothetical protein [Patescibacteria group bacterium]